MNPIYYRALLHFLADGFLYGQNMEVNNFNKKPILLFDGVGKCLASVVIGSLTTKKPAKLLA